MGESEFKTDIESCYLVTCANNSALSCTLVRVHIGTDGICMGYMPIEETSEDN